MRAPPPPAGGDFLSSGGEEPRTHCGGDVERAITARRSVPLGGKGRGTALDFSSIQVLSKNLPQFKALAVVHVGASKLLILLHPKLGTRKR